MSNPEEPHDHVEGIPAVATERNNNLDDRVGREQEPSRMGGGPLQSGSVAGVDSGLSSVGAFANESCAMDRLHKEPCEMDAKERRELKTAIWRAYFGLMVTLDEAETAIAKYCK